MRKFENLLKRWIYLQDFTCDLHHCILGYIQYFSEKNQFCPNVKSLFRLLNDRYDYFMERSTTYVNKWCLKNIKCLPPLHCNRHLIAHQSFIPFDLYQNPGPTIKILLVDGCLIFLERQVNVSSNWKQKLIFLTFMFTKEVF